MAEIVVTTGIDAHVRENQQDTNYKKAVRLHLQSDAGAQRQAFVFFAVPFPLGASVTRADLILTLGDGWAGGPHTITVRRVTTAWKEGTVTWRNRPTTVATDLATFAVTGGAIGDEITIPLAAMLQTVSLGGDWYGVRLEVNTAGTKRLYSSEAAREDSQPRLEVEWSETPLPPIDLRPGGDRVVSVSRPVLSATFRDFLGETTLAAAQFQIDDVDDFVTPLWDSGWVALTELELQAGIDIPLGGILRHWRVRARDGEGLESDWSDPASFSRVAKGVLTITSPGATVEETTPTVAHTFTGAVQESARWTLFEANAAGEFVQRYDTGQLATTDNSRQVPAGLVVREDRDYKERLRVRDDQDREAMAGDPPYVEAEVIFRLIRSATPAPVTWLRATVG